jgi:pimeloyl-ACP methyl ester carboxylesterase
MHHERLDGSGYHRACRAAEIDAVAPTCRTTPGGSSRSCDADFMRVFNEMQVRSGVRLKPPSGPPPPWMRSRPAGLRTMMAAFADALGLGRFHLLGYSGGGFVALALAGRHPERRSAPVAGSDASPATPFGNPPPFQCSTRGPA